MSGRGHHRLNHTLLKTHGPGIMLSDFPYYTHGLNATNSPNFKSSFLVSKSCVSIVSKTGFTQLKFIIISLAMQTYE